MSKLSIANEWETYRQGVLPADAPAVQLSECRRAFYAGAASIFYGLLRVLDPGQEATPADLQVMTRLQQEFELHLAAEGKGYAS